MRKLSIVLIALSFCLLLLFSSAYSAELQMSGDLELFYERSENIETDSISSEADDDKWHTNQLYLTMDGTFNDGYSTRLKLDGADLIGDKSHDAGEAGKVDYTKVVEEANFTIKRIVGSPVSVVFGKDEMPFGQDYDKYLMDPLTHNFEIDKVWGLHAIFDIENIGNVAVAAFESRNTKAESNELGDHYTGRIKVNKLVDFLSFELSIANEKYYDNDDDTTTNINGTSGVEKNEQKYSAGLIWECLENANVNIEYVGFMNRAGAKDYDPALLTAGAEYKFNQFKCYGRYERVFEDTAYDVEEDFFMVGVGYIPVKNYTISLEVANYNTRNYGDAKYLNLAKNPSDSLDELESAILLGIRAIF